MLGWKTKQFFDHDDHDDSNVACCVGGGLARVFCGCEPGSYDCYDDHDNDEDHDHEDHERKHDGRRGCFSGGGSESLHHQLLELPPG